MIPDEEAAKAVIEDGVIVIRVPLANLPMIVDGGWACGKYQTRYQITNAEEFARDLVHELNDEQEDGTTPIHELFDGAIISAIERGAFGVEEHPEQEA